MRSAALAAWLAGGLVSPEAQPAPQPSPGLVELRAPLPLASSVKDPVFAVLLALVESDTYGLLRGQTLESELRRLRASSRVPYREVESVTREPLGMASAARITVRFRGPLDAPIPYSILGYHPGRLKATTVCRFRQWSLGEAAMVTPPVRLGKVHVFAVEEGTIIVDVAGWFDVLMGGTLDDTQLRGWALTGYAGRRIAVAFGDNEEGRGYAGGFDFTEDAILFPPPGELRVAARRLRQCTEALMKDAAVRCAPILAEDVKRRMSR